ncbi:hypothetical protein GGF37_003470, partial [Kickxella alabastrina]
EAQNPQSVSTKRQQQQLESLMTQIGSTDNLGTEIPMLNGQRVGHPISFHHVEHLSPTVVGPKMALINSPDLYKSYTQPNKGSTFPAAPTERKSPFRSFKSASSLMKLTKSTPQAANVISEPMKSVVTFRGKPIGAPAEFQHVEHLSATDLGVKHYQILNHRQQKADIISVLANPAAVVSERDNLPKTAAEKAQKTTYRGLPLSGPVTFEHVEHISVKDYKTHVANSNQSVPASDQALVPALKPRISSSEAPPSVPELPGGNVQRPPTQHGPRLATLQHITLQPLPLAQASPDYLRQPQAQAPQSNGASETSQDWQPQEHDQDQDQDTKQKQKNKHKDKDKDKPSHSQAKTTNIKDNGQRGG